MSRPVIALLTDLGLRDPYVGTMKGVILRLHRDVQLVDLSHNIAPQNVLAGALMLERSASYFPDETIFVAVVDPGIGGLRRPILIDTNQGTFIGPDNGVLSFAARSRTIRGIYHLNDPGCFLKPTHNDFHGRDIFAPIAAYVARGVGPAQLGTQVPDFLELHFPTPRTQHDHLTAQVLWVDHFGNVVTNISHRELPPRFHIHSGGVSVERVSDSYDSLEKGTLGVLWGNHGFLELAVAMGSAADKTGLRTGSHLRVDFVA